MKPYFSFSTTVAACAIVTSFTTVEATFSIVAVDRNTKEVGAAGASCKGTGNTVALIYASVPGIGAACLQANNDDDDNYVKVRDLFRQGLYPREIIRELQEGDANIEERQYGVVTLKKKIGAGFTGDDTETFREDRQGTAKLLRFSYSVQGNTLTGGDVLDSLENGFSDRDRGKKDCDDLPQRLYEAVLEAYQDPATGDKRCTPTEPADTIFLHVDKEDGPVPLADDQGGPEDAFLDIRLGATGGDPCATDCLDEFNQQFAAWRALNPSCE